MAVDRDTALGELRGLLEAFARVNDKADHGYDFSIVALPRASTVVAAIEQAFAGEARRVVATPVHDWKPALRAALESWLFQFRSASTGGALLVDAHQQFALSDERGREAVLDWAMERLAILGPMSQVWRIDIETKRFYECAWADFALETMDGTFLLHLGVSD